MTELKNIFTLSDFPFPPSSNAIYADVPFLKGNINYPITLNSYRDLITKVGFRRIKTEEAKRYQQDCASILNSTGSTTQLREFVQSHVTIDLSVYLYHPKWITIQGNPNKIAGDTDNRIKLLKDIIFKTIDIDDCCVFFDGVRKVYDKHPKVVVILRNTPDVTDEF